MEPGISRRLAGPRRKIRLAQNVLICGNSGVAERRLAPSRGSVDVVTEPQAALGRLATHLPIQH